MNRFRLSWSAAVVVAIVTLIPWADRATAQEVALTPLETTEVARGYRAEAIKLKRVVNDKNETIGRINDFIFGKDGNTYAILAVGDFTGLGGHPIAVPFRNLKLDDPSGSVVLPGASRSALEKLPVFVNNNR
ncbi:PRC-barrel domain-containing protein [Bradyrhizobium sp. AZCC 2230]|uniref:PRC-barrel domain-containing protein n=1 Tax=Bradyrhizobium sp. AZCC 2230 TaxID=3117021 RepID=UPI002FF15F25